MLITRNWRVQDLPVSNRGGHTSGNRQDSLTAVTLLLFLPGAPSWAWVVNLMSPCVQHANQTINFPQPDFCKCPYILLFHPTASFSSFQDPFLNANCSNQWLFKMHLVDSQCLPNQIFGEGSNIISFNYQNDPSCKTFPWFPYLKNRAEGIELR